MSLKAIAGLSESINFSNSVDPLITEIGFSHNWIPSVALIAANLPLEKFANINPSKKIGEDVPLIDNNGAWAFLDHARSPF
jgi:hypothetical protein